MEKLQAAEALVLVFPTWWFGFPAMLKGWFDRVWAPGVAYDHASDLGPIRPRLDKLRHAANVIGVVMGQDEVIDLFDLRLFRGCGNPVRIAKIVIIPACVNQHRLSGRSHHQGRLSTFDINGIYFQIFRPGRQQSRK